MKSSDETVIRNLINYEREAMCRLDRGKYEKIKEVHEVKYTEKRVKLVEGMNKEKIATKSDDADIPRKLWDERFFIQFLHV